MHSVTISHFDSENTKNLGKKAIRHFFIVLGKSLMNLEVKFQFSCRHCLNDELVIMAEKEEAATASGSFSCLEDHVSIELWAQTLVQDLEVA